VVPIRDAHHTVIASTCQLERSQQDGQRRYYKHNVPLTPKPATGSSNSILLLAAEPDETPTGLSSTLSLLLHVFAIFFDPLFFSSVTSIGKQVSPSSCAPMLPCEHGIRSGWCRGELPVKA
jgi:hypothetical protein